MSKVSSDKLFQLIKSLSQSEKRHFKLFASKYEGQGKKYLKLFDAIDLQENYNETKLLETEKYLKPSQLPNLKNYLCQLILKSMRIYGFEKSVSSQLLGYWNDASFLFEKGFYTQCKEIITKSKKIARQHEKYWELFAFLTLEKNVANKNELIEISDEELLTLEKLKNIIEYQKLGHEFASLMYETLHPRNESEIQKYQ
ncbi:hypothetical protein IT568_12980, partial [bacterium]|nr:hypothetical protein [bacterium]